MPLEQPTEERSAELISLFDEIQQQVNAAASDRASGDKPRLVAVSKLKPASDILALYQHGVRHFGENYPQELVDKAKELPSDIEWHFIGALQSNKAKMLASIPNLFALETLTSIKSANHLHNTLSSLSPPRTTPLNVFLQLNTSSEPQKAGLAPSASADSDLLALATHIVEKCPTLRLRGLMTIGSFESSTADGELNPDFEVLVKAREELVEELRRKVGSNEEFDAVVKEGLELSMGMSEDFAQAIRQGSSNVRVGSKIFGKRPPRGV
ncbi:hypothetical protein BCR35DRAFT_321852 [Leucosporidium creatinivorum]|uniref:Pyridoxal phosphate homeostasis protein n=1 Tax=Leucosporidium creatinivorum TaxID=106004 RepID=A0A1Y2EVY6_9BASI|nr:hypothetical protein BCR35DRAFT_321852 [Leucosporidium creatinivorum]